MNRGLIMVIAIMGTVLFSDSFGQSGAGGIANAIPGGADSKVKGFRYPLYDADYVMTTQIFGDTVRMLPDGIVEITQLRMEFYSYEGEGEDEEKITDMTVTSPICYYNQERGVVISDSDVRISREQMVVTGKGFRYDNDNQELKILSNSKVVLKGASSSGSKEKETNE